MPLTVTFLLMSQAAVQEEEFITKVQPKLLE